MPKCDNIKLSYTRFSFIAIFFFNYNTDNYNPTANSCSVPLKITRSRTCCGLFMLMLMSWFKSLDDSNAEFLSILCLPSYYDTKTTWIMPSQGMFSYFSVFYAFCPMFLPLYIRLKSLPFNYTAYKLFNERTIYFSSFTFKESYTVIFYPSPFSLRMYRFCFVDIIFTGYCQVYPLRDSMFIIQVFVFFYVKIQTIIYSSRLYHLYMR